MAVRERNCKPLHKEFFDIIFKKEYTMPELRELADEHALVIGEMKRHELQSKELASFPVFRLFNDDGEEIPQEDYSVELESKNCVGVITLEDKRKKDSFS